MTDPRSSFFPWFRRRPNLVINRFAVLFLLFTLAPSSTDASEAHPNAWTAFASLYKQGPEFTDRTRWIKSFYNDSLIGLLRDLPGQAESELHDLFRILGIATQYAHTGDYASRATYMTSMGEVFDELRRRHVQRADEVESYYERLLTRRDFHAADKLQDDFPGVDLSDYQALRALGGIDGGKLAAYSLDDEGRLQLSAISLPVDGNYVVIVIGCHVAVDAARALLEAGDARRALAGERVFWLLSDAELDQGALEEWNGQFPEFKARIAYDNAAWTEVAFTATPTFHYFRDGALVESVAGWDPETGQGDVTQSLRQLGLLTSGAVPPTGAALSVG